MTNIKFNRLSTSEDFPTSGLEVGSIYFCPKKGTIGVATRETSMEEYGHADATVAFVTPNEEFGETEKSLTLAKNVLYVISGFQALQLSTPEGAATDGIEYNAQVTVPDTATNYTIISEDQSAPIKWCDGLEPVFTPGKTYQISIQNNLAVIGEF